VGWELCKVTLGTCLKVMPAPETVEFLDNYLDVIITLLTKQRYFNFILLKYYLPIILLIFISSLFSFKILGVFERGCIDECLNHALVICVQTLPEENRYMSTLMHMFNTQTQYFYGIKMAAYHHPGYPLVRLQLIRKFCEMNGFQLLHDLFKKPETQWIGAENFIIIIRAMYDVSYLIYYYYYYYLYDYLILLLYYYVGDIIDG